MRDVSVLGVPVYTLARYAGTGRSPGLLRKAGILKDLGGSVRDYGDAPVSPLLRDVAVGKTTNLEHFIRASDVIAKKVEAVGRTGILVCTGGECSSTVGVMAGLRQVKGKPGMLWMDAHGDFNTPETSPSGYIGGMCLAMACGRGPRLGEAVEFSRPLIEEERVVHIGSRALDPSEAEAMRASPIGLFTMRSLELLGAHVVAERASMRLDDSADWIACHLDVDVLDPQVVAAVNYPAPGGMSMEEAVCVIKRLVGTGKLKALEVCALNADLDVDGSSSSAVVGILRSALA